MKLFIKRISGVALFAAISLAACTEKTTKNTQEEIEIKRMDSSARALKENTEKLEDQTKKVEESLEKLDKEFENKN